MSIKSFLKAVIKRRKETKSTQNENSSPIESAGRICPYCGGSGLRNDTRMYPVQLRCSVCGGRGRIPF